MASNRAAMIKKARGLAIQYAFFRLESALLIAGTLLLTFLLPQPFQGWPIWGWPLLGGLGWAALFFSSLSDPETNARLLVELLQAPFDPRRLRDEGLRQHLVDALENQRRFEIAVHTQRVPAVRTWLESRAGEMDAWIRAFGRLIQQLDGMRQDPRIPGMYQQLTEAIETVVSRRRFERNPQAQQRLNESMEKLGKQWEALRWLNAQMAQAETVSGRQVVTLSELSNRMVAVDAAEISGGQAEPLRVALETQTRELDSRLASFTTLAGMIDFGGDA